MAIEWKTEFWVGPGWPNAGPIPNRPADEVQFDPFPRVNPGQPTPPGYYEFVRGYATPGNVPFVARSRASFKAGSTGTVTFTAQITGGITLMVNGSVVIDQDNVTGSFTGTYNATQGQTLDVVLLTDFVVGAPFGYLRASGIELQENRIDPVRVSLSEDLSGLFVDARIGVTLAPGDPLPDEYTVMDAISGERLYRFRGINPVLEATGARTVQGETLLSALARQRFRSAIAQVGPFTGKQVLEIILNAARVPFVTPLPALYLRSGTELTEPSFGAVFITWKKTEAAPTVRSVLERLFGAFQGYAFRADKDNKLEVVPPAWANAAVAATLTLDDIIEGSWNTAQDDSSVINYCEVRSQPWRFEEDQVLSDVGILDAGAVGLKPLGLFGAYIDLVPLDAFSPPTGYDSTRPYVNGTAVLYNGVRYRCKIGFGQQSLGVKPVGDPLSGTNWEVSPKDDKTDLGTVSDDGQTFQTTLPLDDQALSVGDVELNISLFFSQFRQQVIPPYNSGTLTPTITIPEGGVGVLTYTVMGGFGIPAYDDTWEFRLTPDRTAVQITARIRKNPQPVALGPSWIAYRLTVQAGGKRWKQGSDTITARYGLEEHDTTTPGLAESRNRYGSRDLSLDLGLLDVSLDTALKIARSAVENNLNPDVLHTLALAPPFQASNTHLGRAVALPNGVPGVLSTWGYEEAHDPTSSVFSSVIQVQVEESLVPSRVVVSETNVVPISESGQIVPVAGGS